MSPTPICARSTRSRAGARQGRPRPTGGDRHPPREGAAGRSAKKSRRRRARKSPGATLTTNASAVEENIYQVRNQSGQDPLNFPIKVNNRLANLLSMAERGDGRRPTTCRRFSGFFRAELKTLHRPAGRGLEDGPGGGEPGVGAAQPCAARSQVREGGGLHADAMTPM